MNSSNSTYSTFKKKPSRTKAFFICLVIASFLWLFHSLNTVYTHAFKIPVHFINLPQNKKPLVQMPEFITVDVKASGLKLGLLLLKKSTSPLEIDFNTLKTANKNQNYILSPSHIDFESNFNFETVIKHISPDTLYFSEKTGYQKTVPIKVPLMFSCKEGYGYKKPVISPNFITIWGDTVNIKNIDTVYTQPLTLNNLNQSVNTTLHFIKPNNEIYSTINEANVSIEVAQLIEQTISIPITDIRQSVREQVNIFPSKVKIKFTAIQNSFNNEDTVLFKAMINSSKINTISKKCPVFLSTVPGNITIMGMDPKEVDIIILKK